MSNRAKGVIAGVGITLGVLVIGVGVAYAFLGTPPKLARKVGALEELLPADAISFVVLPDMDKLGKLFKSSPFGRQARKLGIEEDFANLGKINQINERTQGRFWDLLGSRFTYASYGEEAKEMLLISQPRWSVRTLWRLVLSKGKGAEAKGIPYSVFSDGSAVAFAGDYFWYASSENLLKKALKIAASENLKEEETFPVDAGTQPLAYGLSRKSGKHLSYNEMRWLVKDSDYGLELTLSLDEPGGALGDFIADIEPPEDYTEIPEDAILFLNLKGVDAYKAWKAATTLSVKEGNAEALLNVDMEKPMATIATDLSDDAFFVMQGWDTDLWYAPARWLFSAKTSSERSFESWEALMGWMFSGALQDTVLTYKDAALHLVNFGEDLPRISYTTDQNHLLIASDSLLIPWVLDAWSSGSSIQTQEEFGKRSEASGIENPVAYLDWAGFKEELKSFLLYAADRSSGFTPADVERKVFPLLDALRISAVLAGVDNRGETVTFTVRSTR